MSWTVQVFGFCGTVTNLKVSEVINGSATLEPLFALLATTSTMQ